MSELAYYAVIHRPEADVSQIDAIDAKYDPIHGLVGSHVTLMFPMPSSEIAEDELFAHVAQVAERVQPFDVRINDTELSWDQWLFLTPTIGREAFNQLHDSLYSNFFEKFWRKDLPYSPHIGIGHFGIGEGYSLKDSEVVPLDEAKYQQALREVGRAAIDLRYTAHLIEVIGVNADYKISWTLKTFNLAKRPR